MNKVLKMTIKNEMKKESQIIFNNNQYNLMQKHNKLSQIYKIKIKFFM